MNSDLLRVLLLSFELVVQHNILPTLRDMYRLFENLLNAEDESTMVTFINLRGPIVLRQALQRVLADSCVRTEPTAGDEHSERMTARDSQVGVVHQLSLLPNHFAPRPASLTEHTKLRECLVLPDLCPL